MGFKTKTSNPSVTTTKVTKEIEVFNLPNMVGKPVNSTSAQYNSQQDKKLTAAQIREVEKYRIAAEKQGYKDGYAKGQQAAQTNIQQKTERFKAKIESIIYAMVKPLAIVDSETEKELVELAIAIAKQIIRREIKQEPNQIIAVVREALSHLPSAKHHITIYLHPADAELVKESLNIHTDEDSPWQIIEDATMHRCGCRVTTETSVVDATIDARVATIFAKLLGGERTDD